MESNETLYYLWFMVIIFLLVILFVAKLKFDRLFKKRQERRRMLSYSKVQLSPDEEGQKRTLKLKRVKE